MVLPVPPSAVSVDSVREPRDALSLASRYAIVVAFVLIVLFFSLRSNTFFSVENAQNIMRQSTIIAIAAVGIAVVLISGGIDISQGAVMAISGLVLINGINAGWPELLAIGAALATGALIGTVNGFFAEWIGLPALMATLGVSLVIRGIGFIWTKGQSVGINSDTGLLQWIGRGKLWIIPAPFLVAALVTILAAVMLRYTVWGRHTYAVGGNSQAARATGISVVRQRWRIYVLGAIASATAGIVLTARLQSAAPNAVPTIEFNIITAAVLGGVSIFGGVGSVGRVLLASLFLATLSNGLTQLNVPTFWSQVVTGVVFLAALSIDRRSRSVRDLA